MKIEILDFEGMRFELLKEFDENPKLIEAFKEKQLNFLVPVEEGVYRCNVLTMEAVMAIASVLTKEERKHFLDVWETWIFPVVAGDDSKINALALLHRLKTTKFMFFYKPGEEDGKPYLIKRFVTQLEVMRDITMRFEPDGVFLRFPFPLPEEEKEIVLSLIDEDRDVTEMMSELKANEGKL